MDERHRNAYNTRLSVVYGNVQGWKHLPQSIDFCIGNVEGAAFERTDLEDNFSDHRGEVTDIREGNGRAAFAEDQQERWTHKTHESRRQHPIACAVDGSRTDNHIGDASL